MPAPYDEVKPADFTRLQADEIGAEVAAEWLADATPPEIRKYLAVERPVIPVHIDARLIRRAYRELGYETRLPEWVKAVLRSGFLCEVRRVMAT